MNLGHKRQYLRPGESPYLVPPADTDYEYAFPYSGYVGIVDNAESVVESRRRLSQEGLSVVLGSIQPEIPEK